MSPEEFVRLANEYSFHDPAVVLRAWIAKPNVMMAIASSRSGDVEKSPGSEGFAVEAFASYTESGVATLDESAVEDEIEKLWQRLMAHEFRDQLKRRGEWVHDDHATGRTRATNDC